MRDFVSVRIEAAEGDSIEVSAAEVNALGAQFYLFADEDFQKIQAAFEGGDRTALLEFTDMKTLMPNKLQWATVVPGSGVWYLVYQPWQTSSVSVRRVEKAS